ARARSSAPPRAFRSPTSRPGTTRTSSDRLNISSDEGTTRARRAGRPLVGIQPENIIHIMRTLPVRSLVTTLAIGLAAPLHASLQAQTIVVPDSANAAVASLVARLDLARYKATVKGLTQFGDRRQGTDRNRRAVDWIEA